MSDTDDIDPLDRATVVVLHSLALTWSAYADVATSEPNERALNRLVTAGLIEAGGTLSFMQPGVSTRLVVDGRWSGGITERQIKALLVVVV